jgi:hypothetical protein
MKMPVESWVVGEKRGQAVEGVDGEQQGAGAADPQRQSPGQFATTDAHDQQPQQVDGGADDRQD